ncbi:hypothetical protein [Synechococcus sp. RedBA-s]|nr:hypothetical protein [Synechococcus sp. RedBA-s]MCP9799910.1 hypothetical protein [Synechococcus sp. RedBA-s]
MASVLQGALWTDRVLLNAMAGLADLLSPQVRMSPRALPVRLLHRQG